MKNTKLMVLLSSIVVSFLLYVVLITYSNPNVMAISQLDKFGNWSSIEQCGNTLIFAHTVDADMIDKTIVFYGFDSTVSVTVDDKMIYNSSENNIYELPSSFYHLINISEQDLGKLLEISISNVNEFSYKPDYDFKIGDSDKIVISVLFRETFDIFLNLSLCMFGLLFIIIYVCQCNCAKQNLGNFYLGLISIFFALWSNSHLFINQILLPFGGVHYFAYCVLLMFLGALVIMYIETLCDFDFTNILVIHIIVCIILISLYMIEMCSFSQTVFVYVMIVCIEIAMTLIQFLRSKNYRLQRWMIYTFVGFMVAMIITIILHIFNYTNTRYMVFIKLAFVFYVLMAAIVNLSDFIKYLADVKNNKELQKMAYTDTLTGLPNRRRFIHDVIKHDVKDVSLVSFDLNNLKYYNDTFGHEKGDELLMRAANVIKLIFGNCYRTGGDEFISICVNVSEDDLFLMKGALRTHCLAIDDIVLEIATGYASYEPNDEDYEDILHRADKMMYRHKMSIKKMSKIQSSR